MTVVVRSLIIVTRMWRLHLVTTFITCSSGYTLRIGLHQPGKIASDSCRCNFRFLSVTVTLMYTETGIITVNGFNEQHLYLKINNDKRHRFSLSQRHLLNLVKVQIKPGHNCTVRTGIWERLLATGSRNTRAESSGHGDDTLGETGAGHCTCDVTS